MKLSAWMRALLLVGIGALPLGCGAGPAKTIDNTPKEPEAQVKIEDLQPGTGPVAEKGDWVTLHYTGWLTDGTQFDSSVDSQRPMKVHLGKEQTIPGFEKGILGMKEGGKRRITIPPELGYGRNSTGRIPANSTLIFEIDLLTVKKG